jgi:hypothetical protein
MIGVRGNSVLSYEHWSDDKKEWRGPGTGTGIIFEAILSLLDNKPVL